MADPFDTRPSRRTRLRGRLLWILGIALGGATVVSAATIMHDTSRRRDAARLVARATAEQVVALATERLSTAALPQFAVLLHLPGSLAHKPPVETLADVQGAARRMGRTDLVDALAFFRWDVAAGRLTVAPVDGHTAEALPSSQLLTELAGAAAHRPQDSRRFTIHMANDPRLDRRAVITAVDFDSAGMPVAVNGLVADQTDVARLIFSRLITDPPVVDTVKGLVHLDTLSLQVRTMQGQAIFGSIGDEPDRMFRATVRPVGPLEGLVVDVAIASRQIPRKYIAFAPQMEMWHLGMLFLCTMVVITAAAALARRELALARARSDFIAGVSHELRMPLAQILLAGETLTMQRERDAAERGRLATSIVREARRLIALVENVLFYSRSGAVAFTPNLEPLSVHDLFADVVEAVQLAVVDAGQCIVLDAATSLVVSADRHLVRQALVNLVDNAIKYGRRGSRVTLGAVTRGPNVVRLYVDDEGPGIPAAERARVFEAYERLARDQTSERTGSGLGLAIVRHIARGCGGDAWLEEAPTRGTRAVIELRAAVMPDHVPEPSGVA